MQIHDFHSKLTSDNEESRLFRALRGLSLVDDPKALADEDSVFVDWFPWTPMGAPTNAPVLVVDPV